MSAVGFDGADVFVREVNARDAFVVGGERDGHAEFAIDRERMILAADAEDQVVAGEIDFHHDVLCGHFLQQIVGPILVHDVRRRGRCARREPTSTAWRMWQQRPS